MVGRKPIEKRLIGIEEGISEIKEKLCDMSPCKPKEEDEVAESGAEE